MTELRLDVERVRAVSVATLSGELDAANAKAVRSALEQSVGPDDPGIVVDLRQLTYIDSAGIRELFALARRLEDRGRELSLVVDSDSTVERTLRYANVLADVDPTRSIADAVDDVQRLACGQG